MPRLERLKPRGQRRQRTGRPVVKNQFRLRFAFYNQPNLKQVGSLGWLSQVPLTLKALKPWSRAR
jgi:hypothetical protein